MPSRSCFYGNLIFEDKYSYLIDIGSFIKYISDIFFL